MSSGQRSRLSHLQGIEGSEYSVPLTTETVPFVGDSPVVDSLYMIGPGDLFHIYFETMTLEKQVNAEGSIILSRIGQIKLGGRTLKEAKKVILEKLQSTYRKSECFVNLARLKTMKIFVTGAVNAPGVYDIAGNTRLSDLLNIAHGFSSEARRGAILIKTSDGHEKKVDLRKFYMYGDLESNPYLTQGGMVTSPSIDYESPWVHIRRDTISLPIQMETGENLMDLIVKYHNFRPPAQFSSVMVKEKGGKEYRVAPGSLLTILPAPGDRIEIQPDYRDIMVGGAVARPGYQPYRSNRGILHYISEAGVLTSSKVAEKMSVIRADGKREQVSVKDGVIYPGDMIYVTQNWEQLFIIYTPILLSLASLTLAVISITGK